MTADTPAPRHSRRGLFIPLIVVLALLVAWTGWWFVLTQRIEQEVLARAEGLREAGWTIQHGRIEIDGWPFRARLAMRDVEIVAPSGHGGRAPELVAEANAYAPLHWVVIAPDGLTMLRGDKGRVFVRADAIRMSVRDVSEAWPQMALELIEPTFRAQPGAEAFPISAAERLTLEARPATARPRDADAPAPAADDLDVLFQMVEGRGREAGPVDRLTGEGRLSVRTEVTLERAGALTGMDSAGVFDTWTRAGGRFANVRVELQSGDSRALLTGGPLVADEGGRLNGSLSVRAERAAPALAGLAGTEDGAVDRAQAAAAAGAAAVAERAPVSLTLEFRDGRTWLGPFTLAPAPRLF
jgi:hypothetical protein